MLRCCDWRFNFELDASPVGEPAGVRSDVNESVLASESVFLRCDGPGRGDCLVAAGCGRDMSTESLVVVAQG
jgi:hypothetical protein